MLSGAKPLVISEFSSELNWTKAVSHCGGEVIPTSQQIVINGLTRAQAKVICDRFYPQIATTLRQWSLNSAQINPIDGGRPVIIPVNLPEVIESGGDAARMLYTATLEVDSTLLIEINDFMSRPRKAALVDLNTELQIIITDASRSFMPSPAAAVQYRRPDYFNSEDLAELRTLTKQNNQFELTYRAQTAPGSGQWLLIRNRYNLIEDTKGRFYHRCEIQDLQRL